MWTVVTAASLTVLVLLFVSPGFSGALVTGPLCTGTEHPTFDPYGYYRAEPAGCETKLHFWPVVVLIGGMAVVVITTPFLSPRGSRRAGDADVRASVSDDALMLSRARRWL
jgi:hypothetical protein